MEVAYWYNSTVVERGVMKLRVDYVFQPNITILTNSTTIVYETKNTNGLTVAGNEVRGTVRYQLTNPMAER